MNINSAHAEISHNATFESIAAFYNLFGISSKDGVICFTDFKIFFNAGLELPVSQLVLSIDGELSAVEYELEKQGRRILESSFDSSGPYIVVEDPFGLRVRVERSLCALS